MRTSRLLKQTFLIIGIDKLYVNTVKTSVKKDNKKFKVLPWMFTVWVLIDEHKSFMSFVKLVISNGLHSSDGSPFRQRTAASSDDNAMVEKVYFINLKCL